MSYASKQQIKTIAERIDSKLDEKVNTSAYNAKVTEYDAKIASLEQTTAEQTEQIADLEAENRQQAFQIADLKNIVYDTVVEDAEYTYDELDVAPIPTHVSDGTNYHKVFDGAETMLAEVQGKTVNAPLAREAVIKGATKKWNQLYNYQTRTVVVPNDITTNSWDTSVSFTLAEGDFKIGHKYLQFVFTDNPKLSVRCGRNGENFTTIRTLTEADLSGSSFVCYARLLEGLPAGTYAINATITDLTNDYGAGNEPTTVEQFLTDNPHFNGYVPHTTGAIASAEITDYTVCGENLWNEEWENGTFNTTTGADIAVAGQIRTKGYVPIDGGKTYKIVTSNASVWMMAFDKDKNVITEWETATGAKSGNARAFTPNTTFTPPYNARYVRWYWVAAYGATYKNDSAVVLDTNGTYSPYYGQTVSVDTEASGLPAVQDEVYCVVDNGYLVTKKTARFAKVDLGTLDYVESHGEHRFYSNTISNVVKKPPNNGTIADIICSAFNAVTLGSVLNGNEGIAVSSGGAVSISDVGYESLTALQFKQAMSGIYLYYELATPVTTELSRVPLTIDFEQVKNVLVSNTNAGIADVATEVQTGVLKNSVVSGVQINGANLWDEEWEVGAWVNGVKGNAQSVRSANIYPCHPDTTYYTLKGIFVTFFDEEKNYLSRQSYSNVFTTPDNAYWFAFNTTSNYGTVYNHDIAIFLGSTAHPYRPYKPPFNFTLPSPQELRSAGTAHDVIRFVEQGDGTWNVENVENTYRLVLNGTEAWVKQDSYSDSSFTSCYSTVANTLKAFGTTNLVSDCFPTMSASSLRQEGITGRSNNGAISINISASKASTQEALKAWLAIHPVVVYFEKATPTVTTLMTGLTEQEVATLIELYGSVEIVGNTNKQYAKPNLKTIIQCEKAVE